MLVRQRIGSPLAFILVAVSTAPLASNTCSFRGVFALHTFTNFASPESIALDFTMSRLASAIVGVAKITIEVAGVPGAAVATSLLELIIKEYDEVKGHEQQCRTLLKLCQSLLENLRRHNMDGPDNERLREAVDNLELTLASALERMRRWPQYNRIQRWWKKDDINDELLEYNAQVNNALTTFFADTTVGNSAQMATINARTERMEAAQEDFQARMLSNQTVVAKLLQSGRQFGAIHGEASLLPGHSMASNVARNAQESEEYLQAGRQIIDLVQSDVPTSLKRLDGQVRILNTEYAQSGGKFSEIWLGEWLGGQKVAVKALRRVNGNEKAVQRFTRQLNIWSRISHPNVLLFLGISSNAVPSSGLSIISAWQEHENVAKYVKKYPEAHKLHLMQGAAEGLAYLHSMQVVHGNVTCSNILVSSDIEAKICDFGMGKILEDVTGQNSVATMTSGGNSIARWMAPELIEIRPQSDANPTTSFTTDVYSFGMSVLECITGERPYALHRRDANVIHEVCVARNHPPRPSGLYVDRWMTDDLWGLLRQCWDWDPEDRPMMTAVTLQLKEIEAVVGV